MNNNDQLSPHNDNATDLTVCIQCIYVYMYVTQECIYKYYNYTCICII